MSVISTQETVAKTKQKIIPRAPAKSRGVLSSAPAKRPRKNVRASEKTSKNKYVELPHPFGCMNGKIWMSEDFNEPMELVFTKDLPADWKR